MLPIRLKAALAVVLSLVATTSLPLSAKENSRVHGVIYADLSEQISENDGAREDARKSIRDILDRGVLGSDEMDKLRNVTGEKKLTIAPGLLLRPRLEDPGLMIRPELLERDILQLPESFVKPVRPDGSAADDFLRSRILLPDINLQLVDIASGNIAAETVSTVHGDFDFPEVAEGRYRLCMSNNPGWQSGCWPKLVSAHGNGPVFIPPISIAPLAAKDRRAIAGRVTMQDGTACREFDYATGVDFTAELRATSVPKTVRANSRGYYVIPQVKITTEQLLVSCGGIDADAAINQITDFMDRDPGNVRLIFDERAVRNVLDGIALHQNLFVPGGTNRIQNVVLPNRNPVAVDLYTESGLGRVDRAMPGSTVSITADILDNQPTALFWSIAAGKAKAKGNALEWRVPETVGSYTVTALASDGRGGWKRLSKVITVTEDPRLTFAGTVIAPNSGAIPSLEVTVNGEKLEIDKNNRFFGKIKPNAAQRYVVNVDAHGFVPLSRVYHRSSTGGSYRLQSARIQTISSRQPRLQSFADPKNEDKTGSNSFVRFQPNSFMVDRTGEPYDGPVNVEVAYLDPNQGEMPGDYDGISLGSEDQMLVSFGAVYVGMTDPAGNRLQLRKGMPAELQVEVAPDAISTPSSLPAKMPVWTYDTKSGFWMQEPVMADRVGLGYRTKVEHFSTVNMDLGTLGNAACVRVQLDYNRTPVGRILRVRTTNGVGGFQTKQVALEDRLNAVYRLLPQSTTTFEMLRQDGTIYDDFQLKDQNLSDIPNNTITLQPGEEMQSQVDLWPDEPFQDCIRLVVASGNINEPDDFYTRKGADTINVDRANAYYKFMDPNDDRLTLEDWLTHNGFQPNAQPGGSFTFAPAANVVELSYVNDGDLGSGRKMHCRKDAERVACVVGNYAEEGVNFNRDPASAVTAHNATSGTGFATVAMEFSVIEGYEDQGRVVKFFTYGKPSQDGNDDEDGNDDDRLRAAGLDENNNLRNHPEICQICHGGSLKGNFPADVASVDDLTNEQYIEQIEHFRNIDPSSFREFDFGAISNLQGTNPENTAKQLNCDYVLDSEPYSAIKDLILGWYGTDSPGDCDGTSNAGIVQSLEPVPSDWVTNGEEALYNNVVAKVCRTCHVAQKNFDFTTFAQFDLYHGAAPYTCDLSMPNAPVTFYRYWIDGFHQALENRYGVCP